QIRQDRVAENDQWRKLQDMHGKEASDLELWQELALYTHRYPSGHHIHEARKVKEVLEKRLANQVVDQLRRIRQSLADKQWGDAQRQMALLKNVPIPAQSQQDFNQLSAEVSSLASRADRQFSNIGLRLRTMSNEADILAAREI